MSLKQQDADCDRVLSCAADWDVLGLSSASAAAGLSPSELRKRYLKLCLQVHPDKNRSDHATPAFRRLSTAHDRLQKGQGIGSSTATARTTGSGCSAARPAGFTEGDAKWRSRQSASAAASGELDRKWWEQKSWREIEAEIAREEAAFQHELVASKERTAVRTAKKALKRKHNDRRVASGLADLYAKYSLQPEPSHEPQADDLPNDGNNDGNNDGGGEDTSGAPERATGGTNPWEAVGSMRPAPSKRPKHAPKPAKQWPPRAPPLATSPPRTTAACDTAPAATDLPAAPPTPPPPWGDSPVPRWPTSVQTMPARDLVKAGATAPSVIAPSGGGGGGGGKWSRDGWCSVVVPDGVSGDDAGMPPGKAKRS